MRTRAGYFCQTSNDVSVMVNVNSTSDVRRLTLASGVKAAFSIWASLAPWSGFSYSQALVVWLYTMSLSFPWPNQANIEPISSSLFDALAARAYIARLNTKNCGRIPSSTILAKVSPGGNLRLSRMARRKMVTDVKMRAKVRFFRCFSVGSGY